MEGTSPSMYFKHIDRHLEGEAAQWVLSTESVRVLIYRGYLELAMESDIEAFHGALTERFKLTEEEARDNVKAMPLVRLLKLRQRASEGLEEYYDRARLVLLDLHGDDGENDALTPLQQSLRSITVEQFASGLRDDWPGSGTRFWTRLLQQQILHDTVSLNEAFKMAEAVSKRMNSEKEREDGKKKQQEKKKRKLAPELEGSDHAKKQKPRLELKFPSTAKPGVPELEEPDHAKKQWPRLKANFQSSAKPGVVLPKFRLKTRLRDWTVG